MPKDCNDFAVLTSAQRYRQCLAMRMVQMFKKTFSFSQSYYFNNKNHIKPTRVDSHRSVSANYSGMRLIVSPSITGRKLMDRQQFLHCFHSLHLHQTGSQRRRGRHGSVGGRHGPQCDKDFWINIFFSEKVMEKSTNEKRQIRMSCVLYCFIFISIQYSQKLIAHVECRC